MSLGDLPAYIESVREGGQSEYVPVVEMGRIVDAEPAFGRSRMFAFAVAMCFFLMVGAGAVYALGSRSVLITADSDLESRAVASMIEDEGGRVFSVKKNEDDTYEVRFFKFGSTGSFLEGLRRNKNLKNVELKD